MNNTPATRRFWNLVGPGTVDECWLWQGAIINTGYGEFNVTSGLVRRRETAHRAAYRYTHGPIPEGMQVNHTCDVRLCVNPAHLYLGTQKDNMMDMARRHRGRPGRYSPEQVRAIRASTATNRALAAEYGCHESTISLIRARLSYQRYD